MNAQAHKLLDNIYDVDLAILSMDDIDEVIIRRNIDR